MVTAACCLAVTTIKVSADTKTDQKDTSNATNAAPAAETSKSDSNKPSAPAANQPADSSRHLSRGEILARSALTYRGLRYRFGGQSSRTGFDCSGLVQAVCAKWGIYLPRVAKAQFSMGKRVLQKDLQPGDLVFFSDTYKHGLSHVGIYIGDGKFLHAATAAKGVIVSDLNEEYHRRHYCGAIRLDLSKLPAAPKEDLPLNWIILDETNRKASSTSDSMPAQNTETSAKGD